MSAEHVDDGAERCRGLWLLAARAIGRARAGLHCRDGVRRAVVAREASGTLAGVSLALEGDRPGELARAADMLARVADEAEREVGRERRRLRRRSLYALCYALTAPGRERSDFERIAGQVLNLAVARGIRERAARERSCAPERTERLTYGRHG